MSHERELIGAIIADHRQLDVVSAIVRERDFIDPVNRRVWRALHVLAENRVPLNDIAAIKDTLKHAGLTIAEIARMVGEGIAAHAEFYARSVRDTARRVRCAERLTAALELLHTAEANTDTVLDDIEAICADERLETEAGIISIGDAARALVAELRDPPPAAICFSGLWSLDEKGRGVPWRGNDCPGCPAWNWQIFARDAIRTEQREEATGGPVYQPGNGAP